MNKVAMAVVVVGLSSTMSLAAAISGTFEARFDSFNEFGVPTVTGTLTLSCQLSCPASAPELRYGLSDGASILWASQRGDEAGYLGSGVGTDPSGVTHITTTNVPAGSAVIFFAKGANCWCGNRALESGYIDVEAATVAVAPWVTVPTSTRQGVEDFLILTASPHGSETVVVTITGAGLTQTTTLSATDFNRSSALIRFTAPQSGTVQVVATLQPYGAQKTFSFTVAASETNTGGGTGAAGGGGGSEEQPSGCASTPGLFVALALASVLKRRAK